MNNVKATIQRGILIVQWDNPPVNALSPDVLEGLSQSLKRASADPSVEGIVVTGGPRVFAAGADIPSFLASGRSPAEMIQVGTDVLSAMERHPKPVIAAVCGYCLGGGMELAMAADLRVASASSRFGQPEVSLGLVPGWNGTIRLPRLIGVSRAADLILTGRWIGGREALEMGLVNRLADEEEVLDVAVNVAREIAAKSPRAVAEAKSLLAMAGTSGGEDREQEAVLRLIQSPDAMEGMIAFKEKRRPFFPRA